MEIAERFAISRGAQAASHRPGFKGLENDVVILVALTDIETDWHRGVAEVGMSRARMRPHVIITRIAMGSDRSARWSGMWRWCIHSRLGDSINTV